MPAYAHGIFTHQSYYLPLVTCRHALSIKPCGACIGEHMTDEVTGSNTANNPSTTSHPPGELWLTRHQRVVLGYALGLRVSNIQESVGLLRLGIMPIIFALRMAFPNFL